MGNRTARAVSLCAGLHVAALLVLAALLPDTLGGGDVMPMRNGPDIVLRDGLDALVPFAIVGPLAGMEVALGLAPTHRTTRRRTLWTATGSAGVMSTLLAGLALVPRPGPITRTDLIAFGWTTAGAVALVVVMTELFLAGIFRPLREG
ncbi:MAG: hypothetical protein ACRDYW_07110 [Acidimicrobiales bacterium]